MSVVVSKKRNTTGNKNKRSRSNAAERVLLCVGNEMIETLAMDIVMHQQAAAKARKKNTRKFPGSPGTAPAGERTSSSSSM